MGGQGGEGHIQDTDSTDKNTFNFAGYNGGGLGTRGGSGGGGGTDVRLKNRATTEQFESLQVHFWLCYSYWAGISLIRDRGNLNPSLAERCPLPNLLGLSLGSSLLAAAVAAVPTAASDVAVTAAGSSVAIANWAVAQRTVVGLTEAVRCRKPESLPIGRSVRWQEELRGAGVQ